MEIKKLIYHLSPPIVGEKVEITDKTMIFSLRKYKNILTKERRIFLKNLNQYAQQEYNRDQFGSTFYHFKVGDSFLEIDVNIEKNEVEIIPYVIYNQETIKKDMINLIYFEQYLCAILRKNKLQ